MEAPLPKGHTDHALLGQIVNVHRVTFQEGQHGGVQPAVLYDWWRHWNAIYFQSTLMPLFITEGNTDYGKYLGFCQYTPERRILIQQRSIQTEASGAFASHHGASVRRHPVFAGLEEGDYNIALLLLHEMMHQACFEAGQDAGHNSPAWAAWCNLIGQDLGLTITFSQMKKGKKTVPTSGEKKKRITVMLPVNGAELLPGTTRFAEYAEQCRFPWQLDSPFIRANTKTLEEGRLVAANEGDPVDLLPQF